MVRTFASRDGRFRVEAASADVSWILFEPSDARAIVVLAHGAGADMHHASMTSIATELARRGVAVLRFNFPFMETRSGMTRRGRVDSRAVSTAAIASAVGQAHLLVEHTPLFLGGHSFGGRMASHAILEHDLGDVRGLIFCSFPLHPAGKPDTSRAAHLDRIAIPMLFLSGTRDALAEQNLLSGVTAGLSPLAELVWLDTADHGYNVLKRSRTRADSVFEELADVAAAFINRVC